MCIKDLASSEDNKAGIVVMCIMFCHNLVHINLADLQIVSNDIWPKNLGAKVFVVC